MYDPHEPLFPFGHGPSYTTFDYRDLGLAQPTISHGEIIDISLTVENTGNMDSDEAAG